MVDPIILKDTESGKEYRLEFDKETVKWAEARGFNIEDLSKYPMSKTEELFYYAFRKNHKNVSLERAQKLLEGIGTLPDEFMKRLIELYSEPFSAFSGDEDGEQTPFVKVEL